MICTLMTVAGVVTGVVVSRATGKSGGSAVARSLLKSAIKGSLQAGKAVQAIAHQAREGISDVTAEVKADIAKNTEAAETKAAV
jgi:hypothetical protein